MQELYRLSEDLGLKLKAKALTLVLAESCTGGLVAESLTQVPGSSHWFDSAIVSYSNTSKTKLLHVPELILSQQGAVSFEAARLMAEGALKVSGAQVALSLTGIAGPEGGSVQKPVGLVYFALSFVSQPTELREQLFSGSRSEIRAQSARYALEWLLASL